MLKKLALLNWVFVVSLLAAGVLPGTIAACSEVAIADGADIAISARTMDFPVDLKSALKIVPRGMQYTSDAPNGEQGISWTSKYGFVGVNALDLDRFCDGLNEKGLSAAFLWLEETEYPVPASAENALSIQMAGAWILGNFATVDEVKSALQEVTIWGEYSPEVQMVPPFHIAIHDALGNHLVVEFIKGEMKLYDNPNGVLTNDPAFDWQSRNLAFAIANEMYIGILPGGSTTAARFVLLSQLKDTAPKPDSVKQAIEFIYPIINRVNSAPGEGISTESKLQGPFGNSYTQWTAIRDHTDTVFYYSTLLNPSLRAIDLKECDLSEGQPVRALHIDSDGANWFQDMTAAAK